MDVFIKEEPNDDPIAVWDDDVDEEVDTNAITGHDIDDNEVCL